MAPVTKTSNNFHEAGSSYGALPLSLSPEERITAFVTSNIRMIARDTNLRLADSPKDPSLLSHGVYFPNSYCLAAKKVALTTETYRQNGSFYHGFVSQQYFSYEIDETKPAGKRPFSFQILDGKLPTEAQAAATFGPTFLGGGEVCFFIYYRALEDLLGPDKFNKLFSFHSCTPYRIDSLFNPLFLLLTDESQPASSTPEIGKIYNFRNTPLYPLKHVNGESFVRNVICVQSTPVPLYCGLELPHEGVTEEALGRYLMDEYNKDPIDDLDIVTSEVARRIHAKDGSIENRMLIQSLRSHRFQSFEEYKRGLTQEEFSTMASRAVGSPYEAIGANSPDQFLKPGYYRAKSLIGFNMRRVEQLYQAKTPEAARKLFNHWHLLEHRQR